MTTAHYRTYALIPGPDADSWLVHETPDGATLPSVDFDDDPEGDVGLIADAFAARYGLRLTKRQSIARWRREDNAQGLEGEVWVVERHDSAPLPAGLRPVAADETLRLTTDALLSDALRRWRANGTAPHADAEPWSRPGWYADTTEWMRRTLAEHGLSLRNDVRQVKVWPLSCVLRGETETGSVFLKAVPPVFGAEPGITAALAERFPAHVPSVIAVDRARGWTLMRDHGAQPLRDNTSVEAWETALRYFGAMQAELMDQPERVLAAGAVDRRVGARTTQTRALFDACRELLPIPRYEAMLEALATQADQLEAAEDALTALGIAPTLVHGDFHANNVGFAGERVVIYDWTDAALAHPFIDLFTMLEEARLGSALADQMPGVEARLTDAYLTAFRERYPAETLAQAVALIQPVAALYMVTSYVGITRALAPDDRADMQGALAFWVRRLVELVNEGG